MSNFLFNFFFVNIRRENRKNLPSRLRSAFRAWKPFVFRRRCVYYIIHIFICYSTTVVRSGNRITQYKTNGLIAMQNRLLRKQIVFVARCVYLYKIYRRVRTKIVTDVRVCELSFR